VQMSMEHRGFIASWPQFGVPRGLCLANLPGGQAMSITSLAAWLHGGDQASSGR
jgi:hypothetical protein